jgi:cytochrome c biogenesis protein CcmG, thiol:disulfide interchange protein DsbE
MKRVVVALALAASGTVAVPRAAETRAAPDVSLRAEQGGSIRLNSLKGHVVLVDFWASWCAPCKTSFPALDAIYRELHARGLEVLAVNVDEQRKDADAFLAAEPHVMPVFFDPNGDAPAAFGVKGMPTSYLLDRAGNIRFMHMGYSATVGRQYREEIGLLLSEHQS